ncbi:MAG: sulfite exporter TauE/SafE family protein, partial [Oscillospiraceae bacterium]
KGFLPMNISLVIGAGSLFGSVIGVYLNKLLPSNVVTILLYVVVFCSGFSILLRKDKKGGNTAGTKDLSKTILFVLGLVTATICSFSGAGGPILVMPLLIVLGIETRSAIGIALFDSIFIALPAIVGYMSKSTIDNLMLMLVVCGVSHAVGILLGSHSAHKIPQRVLKVSVAIFSICIAVYKIAGMFL